MRALNTAWNSFAKKVKEIRRKIMEWISEEIKIVIIIVH